MRCARPNRSSLSLIRTGRLLPSLSLPYPPRDLRQRRKLHIPHRTPGFLHAETQNMPCSTHARPAAPSVGWQGAGAAATHINRNILSPMVTKSCDSRLGQPSFLRHPRRNHRLAVLSPVSHTSFPTYQPWVRSVFCAFAQERTPAVLPQRPLYVIFSACGTSIYFSHYYLFDTPLPQGETEGPPRGHPTRRFLFPRETAAGLCQTMIVLLQAALLLFSRRHPGADKNHANYRLLGLAAARHLRPCLCVQPLLA